jgi:hypothetical protein
MDSSLSRARLQRSGVDSGFEVAPNFLRVSISCWSRPPLAEVQVEPSLGSPLAGAPLAAGFARVLEVTPYLPVSISFFGLPI